MMSHAGSWTRLIDAERRRQDAKWGGLAHDSHHTDDEWDAIMQRLDEERLAGDPNALVKLLAVAAARGEAIGAALADGVDDTGEPDPLDRTAAALTTGEAWDGAPAISSDAAAQLFIDLGISPGVPRDRELYERSQRFESLLGNATEEPRP